MQRAPEPQNPASHSHWAFIGCATISEIMLLILPSFVGALTDELDVPRDRIGLLGSADMLGLAIAGASGPFWVRRVSWKRTALGALAVLLLCNAVCFGLREFSLLFFVRLLAGMAAGVLSTINLTGILSTAEPVRNASFLLLSEVVVSAIGIFILDSLPAGWRLDAVYAYVLLLSIPFVAVVWRYLPDNPGGAARTAALRWGVMLRRGALPVLGAAAYFLMIGGIWGYLEGIARAAGLPLYQTGQAVSAGLLISVVGAGAAAAAGLRLGRAIPLVISAITQITALCLLMSLGRFSAPLLTFYGINALFQIAWNYVAPYFMLLFKEVDSEGRFVPAYSLVMHLMLAVGPYVSAFFIHGQSYTGLLTFGLILALVCYASFLSAVWLNRGGGQGRVVFPA